MKMKTRKGVEVEVACFYVNDSGSRDRMKKFEELCRKYNLNIDYSGVTPSARISNIYGDDKLIWNGEWLVAVANNYFFVCHENIVVNLFKDVK